MSQITIVWYVCTQRHEWENRHWTYIHQSRIDVVAALSVYGDEEGEAPVGRKAVHEAVLVLVPWQQGNAAVFGLRLRSHWVQRLCGDSGRTDQIRQCCSGIFSPWTMKVKAKVKAYVEVIVYRRPNFYKKKTTQSSAEI